MSSAFIRFSLFKTQGRAQPNTTVPVCSILKSDFGFKGQHLPRSPWLGVYNTGSGLPTLSVISTPRGSRRAAPIA